MQRSRSSERPVWSAAAPPLSGPVSTLQCQWLQLWLRLSTSNGPGVYTGPWYGGWDKEQVELCVCVSVHACLPRWEDECHYAQALWTYNHNDTPNAILHITDASSSHSYPSSSTYVGLSTFRMRAGFRQRWWEDRFLRGLLKNFGGFATGSGKDITKTLVQFPCRCFAEQKGPSLLMSHQQFIDLRPILSVLLYV